MRPDNKLIPDLTGWLAYCLLLDINLTKCNGVEILKCLRSTERYAQRPIIAMTAQTSAALEAMANRHAALVYFPKPSSLDRFMDLGSVVRQLVARTAQPGAAHGRGGAG